MTLRTGFSQLDGKKSLRRVFLLLMGVFVLLSGVSGMWQLGDGLSKVRAVEWIYQITRPGDLAQRASAQLAMERGITATILANPAGASADMQAQMRHVRAVVDDLHVQIMAIVSELSTHEPDHVLFAKFGAFHHSRAQIERFRRNVDAQLLGDPNSLGASRWIALVSKHIEGLQNLAVIGLPLLPAIPVLRI